MSAQNHDTVSAKELELGFWLYLMSDAVIFALLFMTYGVMRGNLAGGPGGQSLFELNNVFNETVLLLSSTMTCGLALNNAAQTRAKAAMVWLAATFVLGAGFIGLEFREFAGLIQQGAGPSRSGFLSAFFTLVGTHGLHVSAGLIWLAVMLAQISFKGLSTRVYSRLFRFSLFWHFLDLIWIFIFSVVYLPGAL